MVRAPCRLQNPVGVRSAAPSTVLSLHGKAIRVQGELAPVVIYHGANQTLYPAGNHDPEVIKHLVVTTVAVHRQVGNVEAVRGVLLRVGVVSSNNTDIFHDMEAFSTPRCT